MATRDAQHRAHPHSSPTSISECILGLRDNIKDEVLPGFVDLIDDWFDPAVPVEEEHFVRRFLSAFKQSGQDFTYEKVVGSLNDGTQSIINDFVDGKIDADQAGQRYHCSATENVPSEIRSLLKRSPASIIPPGTSLLKEPVDLLRATPSSLPSRILSLIAKVAPGLKDPSRALYVPSFKDLEFHNWGRTVATTPTYTCVPSTARDVSDIVKYAKRHRMGVRVAGFRHSWSPIFGRSPDSARANRGDILISTLGLVDASILPNFTSLPTDIFQPRAKDLNSIVLVDEQYVKGPRLAGGKQYVRVGTATTNEQLRRWCISTGKLTLPFNIIEVEITLGGSNATICHGAGIKNPTLSDLVRCLEYVDANGVLRKIDMSTPDLLRAAAGCLGLIGVVTHLVLEFDPLSCALMAPRKVPAIEAIPPPPGMPESQIPGPLRPVRPFTSEEKARHQKDFETRALTHDYAEWFWFPYSSQVWVNTWEKTLDTSNAVSYPSNTKTILQVLGTIMTNIAQNANILLRVTDFLPEKQTKLLTWLAMMNLDDVGEHGEPIKTWLPDALHFQRGVQNVRVRDLEVEFPLQPRDESNGADQVQAGADAEHQTRQSNPRQIDWTLVQRAWWDAIVACYAAINDAPQRMPLELRIMGGSQVTLAPQRGNELGTCSMEILTLHAAADIWQPYAQGVLDKWTSYKNADGEPISPRPHWAKEWYGYTVRGQKWEDVLRSEERKNGGFKHEIAEWRTLIDRLAQRDEWTLEDARTMFGNDALDAIFWPADSGNSATVTSVNGLSHEAASMGKQQRQSSQRKRGKLASLV